MLKNGQTCSHRKIFKVCLAICQHYEIKGKILTSNVSSHTIKSKDGFHLGMTFQHCIKFSYL